MLSNRNCRALGSLVELKPIENKVRCMNEEQAQAIQKVLATMGERHAEIAGKFLIIESALKALIDRSDNPQAREQPGTGLGLTITQGLVVRHGGEIWAEAEPGQGAAREVPAPGGFQGVRQR